MINWRRGGWTGSVNRWVRREVREQLRANPAARRARYPLGYRALRAFFRIGTFLHFVGLYVAINVALVLAEAAVVAFRPEWIPAWTAHRPDTGLDTKSLILDVSGYLIGAQVGMLGVISLALALVTLIAQREGSSTDVQVYYHQSLAFELVASCVALLAVMCVQLLWPLQFFLHRAGFGTHLLFFKLLLLGLHTAWLILNLGAVAYFIATTFRFVQQRARELLRERYTANVVAPRDMTKRLRQQVYRLAASNLTGVPAADGEAEERGDPRITFGFDYGDPQTIEIETQFARPSALHDVRMLWVRWVLNRWTRRCIKVAGPMKAGRSLLDHGPILWFTPHMDHQMKGKTGWCRRRGGVPLTSVEKFVLRHAFRFRRMKDAT